MAAAIKLFPLNKGMFVSENVFPEVSIRSGQYMQLPKRDERWQLQAGGAHLNTVKQATATSCKSINPVNGLMQKRSQVITSH